MPDYDLAIVGGGPGGYVAAIRAAQLGMKTALVERDKLGGICLNWGCIPTKALLRNAELASLLRNNAQEFGISFDNLHIDYLPAMKRSRKVANRLSKGVEFLMKKNAVSVIQGEASLADKNTLRIAPSGETLSAQRIILATGSRPASLPGLEFDGQRIISSDHAVVLESNPAKVVIIGAGAVGVEFAYLFRAYG
ncbi:MAG: FAD-dependent oxidoreductase, partial [Chloroflexi bacterium]|nr:FAD-dependent oxidoreductase [Chloroflexota bacterium]